MRISVVKTSPVGLEFTTVENRNNEIIRRNAPKSTEKTKSNTTRNNPLFNTFDKSKIEQMYCIWDTSEVLLTYPLPNFPRLNYITERHMNVYGKHFTFTTITSPPPLLSHVPLTYIHSCHSLCTNHIYYIICTYLHSTTFSLACFSQFQMFSLDISRWFCRKICLCNDRRNGILSFISELVYVMLCNSWNKVRFQLWESYRDHK